MAILFNGEMITVENGEEPFTYRTTAQVLKMIKDMKDGDTLVINARLE